MPGSSLSGFSLARQIRDKNKQIKQEKKKKNTLGLTQGKTKQKTHKTKALHGRLAGRFKPPLAGRCNDFAPSRQKNCHRQKQPSRPSPRKKKKKHRPVPSRRKKKKATPSRLGKKKQPPRPASEKKNPAPSRLEKKTKPPRPAMNSKIHRPEGGNWKQIPPPVSFSLFLVAHLDRIVV